MYTITDLKPGLIVMYNGQPHEVLEAKHLKKANEIALMQTKLKNLITGGIIAQNFKHADKFAEAEIIRKRVKFLYSHRGDYWFSDENNPANRLSLKENQLGSNKNYLKAGTIIDSSIFEGKVINIILPIKIDLKIIEAPPGVKGDRSESGTKEAILETGAKIKVPLFIEEGETIRVNTQTGEYVERVKQ